MPPDVPQGPWTGLQPATIRYCEENLSGIIAQPSNTWSNLAYAAAAAVTWVLSRTSPRKHPVRLIPLIALLVGISSFLYHASFTFVFQCFDLGSMYLLSAFLLTRNASRKGLLPHKLEMPAFWAIVAVSVALMVLIKGVSGMTVFGIEIVAALSLELSLASEGREKARYADLLIALALFFIAWGFWWLDTLRLISSPSNHVFQGHAAWHVVNAACFIFIYRFYVQFPVNDMASDNRGQVG